MLPEKADAAYLWDMLDAARAVKEFVAGKTLHDYQKNRMLRGAVERHVEIIGEAANRVSTGFQSTSRCRFWGGCIESDSGAIVPWGMQ